MVSKSGIGIGGNDTNQRITDESTNSRIRIFEDSHKISRFVSYSARGFTLVDLMIAFAIFAIITTVAIVQFNSSGNSSKVRLSAQIISGALNSLRESTQAGLTAQLCDPDSGENANKVCGPGSAIICSPCVARVPSGGYGLYVDGSGLRAFVDGDGNHIYDADESLGSLDLTPGVELDLGGRAAITVVFEPPEGVIWIDGAQGAAQAQIGVRYGETGAMRNVTVYRISGRIED